VLLRFGFTEPPDVPRALADVTTAEFGFDADDAVYVIGHETVIPTGKHPGYKVRDRLFAIMHRNAASPVRFFGLPPERVIEVGVQVRM
jgi:KUP system potassium uptake protein